MEGAADLHLSFRHETRASWPEIGRAVLARANSLGVAEGEVSRSTLKRVLKDVTDQGVVSKEKGAGGASSKAYGFWITEKGRP